MKIRNGFVSNSSSSSFIIGFTQKPDAEYLKRVLYDNKETFAAEYEVEPFSTDDLVSWIMGEINISTPITDLEGIVKAIDGDGMPYSSYPDWNLKKGTPEYEAVWETYNQLQIENDLSLASQVYDESLIFYELSFADEDGKVGCELEHGSTWNALPHLKFSHH